MASAVVAVECNAVGPCPTVALGRDDVFVVFRGDFLVGDNFFAPTAADGVFVETLDSEVLTAWATGGLVVGNVEAITKCDGTFTTEGTDDVVEPAPASTLVLPFSKS